jgi:prolyl oligopeptidase
VDHQPDEGSDDSVNRRVGIHEASHDGEEYSPELSIRARAVRSTVVGEDSNEIHVVDLPGRDALAQPERGRAAADDGGLRTPRGTTHPALLTGYGGYNISLTPNYPAPYVPLLERGVVFAEANLRGGGEYGEDWHTQGKLTKKQNVFDDFAACAKYLIAHKYTQPSKLAIIGGSNGGLLMGAALTQHPEMYHAVVSMVGIYDMLRVELSPNGAFNVTEFGTVKEADQFKALYAYSPYHHVKDGTQYPAILLTTGDNDARVDPMQSRKMAARLEASGTKQPVLLRTSSTAGHGIGSSIDDNVALWTDIDAFLLMELGGGLRPPGLGTGGQGPGL